MWTSWCCLFTYCPVKADQIFDVLVIKPVLYPICNTLKIFFSRLNVEKSIFNGVEITRYKGVTVVMSLDSSDQCGDGVNITPPKLLPVPFGFYRSGSASAEDVCNYSDAYVFLFGVPQGFGCDERWEFRRIAMNSMYRIFFLIPEVPIYRGISSATHSVHRVPMSADCFVLRVSTQFMRIRPNIRAYWTFRQGYAFAILSLCTRVSFGRCRAGQELYVRSTSRISLV